MGKIVGVRFSRGCRVYDFDAGAFVLARGDQVIVQTEQGLVLGEVVNPPRPPEAVPRDADAPPLKQVYRLATEEDLAQQEANHQLEREAHKFCLERIDARKMEMNLGKVECLFDRSKIIFYFTAEGRLDFRELVRDLVGRFKTRVEMRQVGVRHEAKLLGGLGSCGRELCCATFLRDFEPVSVKMAKEQNLSLNPTKISGLCGRLMCCLIYEFQTYKEMKQGLPKVGKRLKLKDGAEAKVIRQNVLERQATLVTNDGRELVVGPEELAELVEPHGGGRRQAKKPDPQQADDNKPSPPKGRGRRKKKK